jgi:small subunit ribosomal protein S18
VINYKDVDLLKGFVSREGKIMARRATGTCARHQRELAIAIKQARHIALLPFASEVLR